jgi:hypothetical protein
LLQQKLIISTKKMNDIEYKTVPSLAMSRYSSAFRKHDKDRFAEYIEGVIKGEEKINTSAVYPYDIVKNIISGNDKEADAQWANLPDYLEATSILPIVDVSGSMYNGLNPQAIDVSLSLGLYLSERNKSAFKDIFVTFSAESQFNLLQGSLSQRLQQLRSDKAWGMNTNIVKAFKKILDIAVSNKVLQEDMPQILLILSDMQFDQCAIYDDSAMQSIERQYKKAEYAIPKIVFWNLCNRGENIPVSYNKDGVAVVSGFSPTIMKAILKNGKNFNPRSTMLSVVDSQRYRLDDN